MQPLGSGTSGCVGGCSMTVALSLCLPCCYRRVRCREAFPLQSVTNRSVPSWLRSQNDSEQGSFTRRRGDYATGTCIQGHHAGNDWSHIFNASTGAAFHASTRDSEEKRLSGIVIFALSIMGLWSFLAFAEVYFSLHEFIASQYTTERTGTLSGNTMNP